MNTDLTTYNVACPIGSLEAYIHQVFQAPILEAEEERALAEKVKCSHDLDAARQLIISHLRYVVQISYRYKHFGLPLNDLIQEGTIGLMKAVKRFDPSMGARLATFALQWIKSEIFDYIVKNWRIVKVATTKAQRKLFTQMSRLKGLSQEDTKLIADTLGVQYKDVKEMEMRLNQYADLAFDPITTQDDEDGKHPEDYLAVPEHDPAYLAERCDWLTHRDGALYQRIHQLDARSQEILRARYLSEQKASLSELAKRYGLSIEGVRKIEKKALVTLKSSLGKVGILPLNTLDESATQ